MRKFTLVLAMLLVGIGVLAQEYPVAEVGLDYTFAWYNPSAAYNTNGHAFNGGGGTFVYNLNSYFGIKADLQGYGSNTTRFTIPPNTGYPGGGTANVSGNLFTYMFGPQLKFRSPRFEPFTHILFGGAHSTVYGNAYQTICQPVVGACTSSAAPSGNGFAMAVGGGIDIPLTKAISFRPVAMDYLLTNFSNEFNNTNQNNYRFSAGINFNFGSKQ